MLQNETVEMRAAQMIRLIVAAMVCVFVASLASTAVAAPVTEAAVEEACGDKIEGACDKTHCATGCTKVENGKTVDYGCRFPNKPGKTKATCSKTTFGRTVGASSGDSGTGGLVLDPDAGDPPPSFNPKPYSVPGGGALSPE
jgi:hypothetical protein